MPGTTSTMVRSSTCRMSSMTWPNSTTRIPTSSPGPSRSASASSTCSAPLPNNTPGFPFPTDPNDPFTNGGGLGAPTGNLATQQQSAFVRNIFTTNHEVFDNFDPDILATGVKQLRVGHEQALQRSSRAADGTPLHIRNDGPGLSSLDVPDGST